MKKILVRKNESYDKAVHQIYKRICLFEQSILFISGSMGAGKTTLASSLISYYGGEHLNSASYGIVSKIQGPSNIIHCDFYRYRPTDEFMEVELLPLLKCPFLLIIEWGSPKILFYDSKHFLLKIESRVNGDRVLDFEEIRV